MTTAIPPSAGRGAAAGGRTYALMLLLAGVAAFAALTPCIFLGYASGHDFEFHLASWMEVSQQWKQGALFPRWAELANWGFGEPRFIFYPPLSWMLGAALSLIFSWPLVPGAFCWLALVLAGLCMFTLAKQYLAPGTAIAAGLLFALNPYHLVILYWRSDFAELLASAVVPLAILFSIRMGTRPGRAFVPLALVTAGVWLSNAPAAVVVTYTIALVLAITAGAERSVRPLLFGGGALALGLALAGFYIVPAAVEQGWVNISEVISPGVRFFDNFLFTRSADAEHTRFNFLVSWIAVGTMAATAAALLVAASLRRASRRLWWLLAALSAGCVLLMLPVSSAGWRYLPKLQYVQFPWRWLLVLNVPFAFLLADVVGCLPRVRKRLAWAVTAVALAATGFLLARNCWWDPGGVAVFYAEHFQGRTGYFGTDEYGPRGSDHYDLNPKAPTVELRDSSGARLETGVRVRVQEWSPVRRAFAARSPAAAIAAPRLLNYPAWRVEVNDSPAAVTADDGTGAMLVHLPAGSNYVRIYWIPTADQLWGRRLTAFAAVLLLVIVFVQRRHRKPQVSKNAARPGALG